MNLFNKKIIFFSVSSLLLMNGCIAKGKYKTQTPARVKVSSIVMPTIMPAKLVKPMPSWGNKRSLRINRKNIKRKDCVNCYATPISKPLAKVKRTKYYGSYAYTEKPIDRVVKRDSYSIVNKNRYVLPVRSSINSSYSSYDANYATPYLEHSNTTAIQVGAFRRYIGAERYMQRYNGLANRYKVSIKTDINNNEPLHKVRIEGFQNQDEAKRFIYRYRIRDAFLVRR